MFVLWGPLHIILYHLSRSTVGRYLLYSIYRSGTRMNKFPRIVVLGVWVHLWWAGEHYHYQVDGFQIPSTTTTTTTTTSLFRQPPQQTQQPFPTNPWHGHHGVPRRRGYALPAVPLGDGKGVDGDTTRTSQRDVVRRLSHLIMTTIRQFSSAWMTGYLAGSLWDLIRGGGGLPGTSRGMVWGMEFGIVSAIFSGTEALTQFLRDLVTTGGSHKNQPDAPQQQQQQQTQQQSTWLWSTVLRNILLAVYFGRHGGFLAMARSSLLYGGLTYFFVSRKIQRDALLRLHRSPTGNVSSSSSSAAAAVALQELFHQMSVARSSTLSGGTTVSGRPSPFVSTTVSPFPFHTPSNPVNNNNNNRSTTPTTPDNVVDVEFEKVIKDTKNNGNKDDDEQQQS
jgi:hypothetical protein